MTNLPLSLFDSQNWCDDPWLVHLKCRWFESELLETRCFSVSVGFSRFLFYWTRRFTTSKAFRRNLEPSQNACQGKVEQKKNDWKIGKKKLGKLKKTSQFFSENFETSENSGNWIFSRTRPWKFCDNCPKQHWFENFLQSLIKKTIAGKNIEWFSLSG